MNFIGRSPDLGVAAWIGRALLAASALPACSGSAASGLPGGTDAGADAASYRDDVSSMQDAPSFGGDGWTPIEAGTLLDARAPSEATTPSDGSLPSDGGSLPPHAPNGYYVVGNTIYDLTGQPRLFHGVDRPSLEFSATGNHLSASDYQTMASWKARVVRIALNQDYWLQGAAKYSGTYAGIVDQQVQWAEAAGLDVILDLHWSDKGNLANTSPAQQRMADTNSLAFWQQAAARYTSDGRVLYELYNEPHDVPWNVWLSGGASGDGFTVVGMQALYDAVRATGAENLVVIGGLNWAYDLSGVPMNRVVGHNIVYATHPYDQPGKQPGNWDKGFGFLTQTDPVIITEFGDANCATAYYSALIAYADQHKASWTSWAWYVGGCGFPSIISDWNGTPSATGQVVKTALLGY